MAFLAGIRNPISIMAANRMGEKANSARRDPDIGYWFYLNFVRVFESTKKM